MQRGKACHPWCPSAIHCKSPPNENGRNRSWKFIFSLLSIFGPRFLLFYFILILPLAYSIDTAFLHSIANIFYIKPAPQSLNSSCLCHVWCFAGVGLVPNVVSLVHWSQLRVAFVTSSKSIVHSDSSPYFLFLPWSWRQHCPCINRRSFWNCFRSGSILDWRRSCSGIS